MWLGPIRAPPLPSRELSVWENNYILQSIHNWTGIPHSVIYDMGKTLTWQKAGKEK